MRPGREAVSTARGEAETLQTHVWSLPPSWVCIQPKRSPSTPNSAHRLSALGKARASSVLSAWLWGWGSRKAHHRLRLRHSVTLSGGKECVQYHPPAWLCLYRLLLCLGRGIFQGFPSLHCVDPGTPVAMLRAGVKEAPQRSVLGRGGGDSEGGQQHSMV